MFDVIYYQLTVFVVNNKKIKEFLEQKLNLVQQLNKKLFFTNSHLEKIA